MPFLRTGRSVSATQKHRSSSSIALVYYALGVVRVNHRIPVRERESGL
jgi:hypothetical protein